VKGKDATSTMSARRASNARCGGAGKGKERRERAWREVRKGIWGSAGKEVVTKRTGERSRVHGATRCVGGECGWCGGRQGETGDEDGSCGRGRRMRRDDLIQRVGNFARDHANYSNQSVWLFKPEPHAQRI